MRISNKGFSIIEVLIGVAIFMVGMLGVALLQVSSMKNNAYSGNLAEAMSLGSAKLEELASLPFDDADLNDDTGDGSSSLQDQDDSGGTGNPNGIDDTDDGTGGDAIKNFGLDNELANRDHPAIASPQGTNNKYIVYWNVADSVIMKNTKTIKVFVQWSVKGVNRRIGLQTSVYDSD